MPRTKKIYWSPDAIKMLMKLYKEQPHLYDSKHEHYFNKDLRTEAFRQIVLEMRKIYENVLSTDIKTKICTLRSQYLSYLKKEKKNGMAKPNWVLCVEFLRPFLKPPENQISLDCDIKPEADSDAPNCLSNDESEAGSTFDPLLTAPNDKLDIVKPKKIIWSPEAIKTLIEQYGKRPNLYDPKHDQYRNKQLRAKSLRQMVKEMRKIYETIDTTDIKNKIGTLRSQYLVHLKNEACYQKSGLETHERMAPFCVKYIEFLRPHLRFSESQRTSESDTNNTEIKPEAGTESPSSCLGQDPHHFEIHKTEIKPENVCQVEEDDDKCESDSSLELSETLNTKKTKKIRWHPESIRMLILLYKSHPILYDPQHPGYRCKHDRAKSLQEIVAEMRKLYDTIDTADIKNKFSTLRSHYLSLLKIQSNWGTCDKTVPAWVEYIQFLKPFVKLPNKQTDEIKSEIDFDCSNDYESDTNSSGDPLLSSHIQATDITWRPDGIRMLIKLYERCPNLYDPNHKQYRNKVLRANSFQQILKEMRKIYERIDMADINSKIVSLRSQYLRYLKQNESNKSAPFWVAYITFLKPYLKFTSDSGDFNMPAETDTEVPCYLSDLQSASLPSIDPLMDSLDDGRTSNKRKFKADVEAFGELIKAEMEQIENPSKRRELRMKLLKVIAEGVD
ncbi:uncharacterized protein DMAD_05542 [Drosophila madeirensis]|uniref:MADF domain-containing protein n=1 Tax=Drosophila madeirensis TaxID=30013 RepID=A0AAU9FMB0_DROMD